MPSVLHAASSCAAHTAPAPIGRWPLGIEKAASAIPARCAPPVAVVPPSGRPVGRVTSFWAPLVPAAPRNSTALSARHGLFWAIRRRVASLFGDFRTGGSHKVRRGLSELTPDVRSVLARRGRVETARPRTCCIVLKRYPWSRTAARRRRTHTDDRSRTSLETFVCRSSWAPSLRHRSRGSKSAPARTASTFAQRVRGRVGSITAPFGGRGGPRWRPRGLPHSQGSRSD